MLHQYVHFLVCEEVCDEANLFEDGQTLVSNVRDNEEAREMIKSIEQLTALEDRVKVWMRRVQEVRFDN